MLTIHVWPKRLKEFLLTHPLYKSPKKKHRAARLEAGGAAGRGTLPYDISRRGRTAR